MRSESDALRERLRYLDDYTAVAGRLDELFGLVRIVKTNDELVRAVMESFSIGAESAQILLDLPIRQWGPEGAQRRAAEIDELRRQLDESE